MPDPQEQWTDPITGITYQGRPWWAYFTEKIAAPGLWWQRSVTPTLERRRQQRAQQPMPYTGAGGRTFFPLQPTKGTVFEPGVGLYGGQPWKPKKPEPYPFGEEGFIPPTEELAGLPEWMYEAYRKHGEALPGIVFDIKNLADRINMDLGEFLGIGKFAPDKEILISLQQLPPETLQKMYTNLQGQSIRYFDPRSQEGRVRLAEAVSTGRMSQEEAFGAGSQWEKWQHGEVDVAREARFGQMRGATGQPLTSAERLEKEFPESEGAALTRYWQGVNEAAEKRGLQMRDLGELMRERPDWLANLPGLPNRSDPRSHLPPLPPSGGRALGSPITGEDILGTQLLTWLQKPEGQKAYAEHQAEKLTEYGAVYPAYLRWRETTDWSTYKPFPEWLETTPTAKATYEAYRFEREAPKPKKIPTWR